jgi:hypothetical protein
VETSHGSRFSQSSFSRPVPSQPDFARASRPLHRRGAILSP